MNPPPDSLDDFIAAARKGHILAYRPTDRPRRDCGWYILACHSEYAPGGFSIWLSDPHRIIAEQVATVMAHLGFEVQHALNDCRMEVWPRRHRPADC